MNNLNTSKTPTPSHSSLYLSEDGGTLYARISSGRDNDFLNLSTGLDKPAYTTIRDGVAVLYVYASDGNTKIFIHPINEGTTITFTA